MATITVTAKDSASAMEDIFEQLGDDAYIIETSKKNGKVSMQATNDSLLLREKNRPSVKAFSSIFDSKLIDSKIAPKKPLLNYFYKMHVIFKEYFICIKRRF